MSSKEVFRVYDRTFDVDTSTETMTDAQIAATGAVMLGDVPIPEDMKTPRPRDVQLLLKKDGTYQIMEWHPSYTEDSAGAFVVTRYALLAVRNGSTITIDTTFPEQLPRKRLPKSKPAKPRR
jgi:hypothetical protein